jgi:hypothetical protein
VRRPVRVVGLTGGIGAGKSEALEAFARHGAATLSSVPSSTSCISRGPPRRGRHFGDGVVGATARSTARQSPRRVADPTAALAGALLRR